MQNRGKMLVGVMVLIASGVASAAPIGVGLLQSMDLTLAQGGNTLFQFSGIHTVGKVDGSQPILLGTAANGAQITLTVKVDQPGVPLLIDRNLEIQINGTQSGAPANLFNTLDDGPISVRLSNMQFSQVDSVNRVEPFHPDDFVYGNLPGVPFVYFLSGPQGFINLPGGQRFSPGEPAPFTLPPPSVQVPKDLWTSNGYGFSKLPQGLLTGFEVSNITDFGGTGAGNDNPLDITPILSAPVGNEYFGSVFTPTAGQRGFVDQIGIALNMRSVESIVPEPASLLMIMGLLPLLARRRLGRQG